MDIDNAVIHLYPASPYICKACVNLRRGGKVVTSVPLANSKACFDFLRRVTPENTPYRIIKHK